MIYTDDSNKVYWVLFCFNGEDGIKSLRILNKFVKVLPSGFDCEKFYGNGN